MQIKEIKAKSCMTKSKLTDYVINPYTGCQHGCKYCYAVFIKKFQDIKEEWGDFVHVKVNCPELLVKELEKNKPGHIWLSSVTDCYSPIEGKYKLTRKILEIISSSAYRKKFTLEILTKSALVSRDFDLLKKLNAELGMSINTLDSKTARTLEPFASPPELRIQTLKNAKERGIKIFSFISPIIPGITDLELLFRELKFCDYVWVELLNTKPSVLQRLVPIIKKNFPQAIKEIELAIENPEKHFNKIKAEAKELEKKYGLKIKEVVKHD